MTNFLAEPCRRDRLSNEKENEIREIFYGHWENMKKQMKITTERINDWRSQSIQKINVYADEQIQILKDDYNHLRSGFDYMRRENLELANTYHTSKQSNLFHELSNTCRLLTFQVAQLEYAENEIQLPKVLTVEKQVQQKMREKFDKHISQNDKHYRESIPDAGTNVEGTRSTSKIAPSRSSHFKQTKCGCILEIYLLFNF